jgi:hypothetical protein
LDWDFVDPDEDEDTCAGPPTLLEDYYGDFVNCPNESFVNCAVTTGKHYKSTNLNHYEILKKDLIIHHFKVW